LKCGFQNKVCASKSPTFFSRKPLAAILQTKKPTMAKYKFTQSQFDDISLLLKRRATESRDEQKKIRAKIRKLGFMISDYFTGFSDIDFKALLIKGDIEIIGEKISGVTQTIKKVVPKRTTPKSNNIITKQALPPIIDKTTEYLVLGTMPGEQSLLNQEYYNNPRNQFWNIISLAFNKGRQFVDYNDKLETLAKNKIGLWDVLDTCEREGSLDSNIKKQTLNNFDKLFKDFPNIKTVVFNGQDSYSYFNQLFLDKGDKKYRQLTSTSSANTHKTLDEKTKEWKSALT
jgi:hypoxanthine-DNA glycosylase